ncbi:MAG: hypothetical protein SVU32_05775, partial [Candidatus Nanohaloarchaea archaeon]|nr:hypothetical protein [Candidatus Nanohaloarchaea archaeon]
SLLEQRFTKPGLKRNDEFFLKNNGSLAARITNVSFTGDLVNRTNISFEYQGEKNVSTPFRLNGNSQATIHLNFSLKEYRDYNGTIKFNVSSELKNYTVTLETDLRVKKDQIPCPVKNGTLCLYDNSINTEYTEKGTHNLTMRVGNRDSNVTNISLTTKGNITALMGQNSTSQIIEVGNQSIREFTLQLMTQ